MFSSLGPLNTTPDKIRKSETLKKGADITYSLFRELERRDVSEVLLQSDLLMDDHWQRSTNK